MPIPFHHLIVAAVIAAGITSTVLADRAKGIDVYSGDGTINWTSVKNAGYSFAFCKSSEGYTFTDAGFATNLVNAKNAGILIAPYHFARPDNNAAVDEATRFYNLVKSYLTPAYLRPVLDFEAGGNTGSTAERASLTQWIVDFMTTFTMLSKGVEPILYTGHNYSKYYLNSPINNYDIWYANYNGASSQTGLPTINDTVAKHWEFWQYSDAGHVPGVGNGTTTNCDVDVANGDINFVRTFLVPEPAVATLLLIALPLIRRRHFTASSTTSCA